MLVRNPNKALQFSDLPIEYTHGTLSNLESLAALVENSDAVIHCAGTVRGVTLSDFADANIIGIENLLSTLAKQSKHPRFLLISSLAARMPDISHYAKSKHLGEEILYRYSSNVNWSIFRPAAIYGQGDRELKPLLDLLQRGISLQLSSTDSRFSLIHVDDVAQAVLQWLINGTAEHEIIELDDGFHGGYGWQTIADIAANVFQRPVRRLYMPLIMLKSLGIMSEFIAAATQHSPMLTSGKVRELVWHDWVCNNQPQNHLKNWEPVLQFEQGLRKLYSIA